MWTRAIVLRTINQRVRLKALRKSLLSKKEPASGSGESAAVHFVQSDLSDFGDKIEMSDDDLAVASTVEILTIAGRDAPEMQQEKEARSSGGIPSR